MGPQKKIAELVKERGYWDGLEPEHLICRHVAKLTEELSEVSEELYNSIVPDETCIEWWFKLYTAGKAARQEFDEIGVWPDYKILSHERMAEELADLLVVIFSMSEVMGIDIVNLALEKAQADVSRGVR